MERTVQVQMLGQLRVVGAGGVVTHFETRRAALVLAYLAAHPDRQHPREAIAEMLWPDEDPEVTRVRFRQVLAGLRRSLEPLGPGVAQLIVADATFVQVTARGVSTDVAEMESCLRAARGASSPEAERSALLDAVALYRGELLPGCYEDWCSLERTRLTGCCGDALLRLVALDLQAGMLSEAVEHALAAVRLDPLREEAHGELIRALVAAGRRGDAQRQHRELERMLKEAFGTAPAPELHALLAAPAAGLERPVAPDPRTGNVSHPADPQSGSRSTAKLQPAAPSPPEPVGGAVPLGSALYITRPEDARFAEAIARRESIVLVKGPRQVGKTSLLARGIACGRLAGARVVLTDLQKLTSEDLRTPDCLFRALILAWTEQLELEADLPELWSAQRSWAANWERFVRRSVLRAGYRPLLWALDEVDRLFSLSYGSEVFGLLRSWHNERALDPQSPWVDLTIAIAYATEAHLFISDLNQSPFNIGTRLTLEDFSIEQVAELNRRHGAPLGTSLELQTFFELLGGHPYLARRGLYELSAYGDPLAALRVRAADEAGPFGDHLRRLRSALEAEPELAAAVAGLLRNQKRLEPGQYYRLRSAGVLTGASPAEARPRCALYSTYLASILP